MRFLAHLFYKQAGIDARSAPHMDTLLAKYPVGSSHLFPNKRVYTDGGRHWELNDMRLRIWAVAMVYFCFHMSTVSY
jgi:hypothetical protein